MVAPRSPTSRPTKAIRTSMSMGAAAAWSVVWSVIWSVLIWVSPVRRIWVMLGPGTLLTQVAARLQDHCNHREQGGRPQPDVGGIDDAGTGTGPAGVRRPRRRARG